MSKTRKSAVAGRFYPSRKSDLRSIIEESFMNDKFGPGKRLEVKNQERTTLGGVSPHAGYVYSGCASAFTYLSIFEEKIPDTVIVLGTDHVGYGSIALMEDGKWETPLGDLTIDTSVAEEILKNSSAIKADDSAFIGYPFGQEHNIEVQLPFIKYCAQGNDVKIVPIKISIKDINKLQNLSNGIASAIKEVEKDVVIIASSDMTHKQPKNVRTPKQDLEDMRRKDEAVIDAFVELDPQKTMDAALKTTVCGPQTITTLLMACKKLGANAAEKLKYYMSYEKMGGEGPCDYSVGYFSGIVKKK